jgi:hypothetical protein
MGMEQEEEEERGHLARGEGSGRRLAPVPYLQAPQQMNLHCSLRSELRAQNPQLSRFEL